MFSGHLENGHPTYNTFNRWLLLDERSDKYNVELDNKRSRILRDHFKNYPKIESAYYFGDKNRRKSKIE